MSAYKHEAGLSVHWVWVGPNGHTVRPASGGVLPFYTLCAASADKHVKTIANTFFIEGLDVHPHNFRFRFAPTRVWFATLYPVATGTCQPYRAHPRHWEMLHRIAADSIDK